ncbi:MAG: rod shape-determining protein [Clostridia bacterium]|nr:rod shape-determining protein [Clostridia bacterium]
MLKVAIDAGTSVTKIYKIGSGIVLAEPSCVAIHTETQQVKAIGEEAKKLVGRTSEGTSVIFPVAEGAIVNVKMATVMLDAFLNKIGIRSGRHRVEALFAVPCGVSEEAKSAIYNVCDELGIAQISFVEAPYLSALGQDLPISDSNPVFVLDMGAGTSNIGVISLDGIIAGISLNLGGNNMDAHIIDHVAARFGLRIGRITGERIKNTIGSLIEGDNQSMVVNGRDIAGGRPRSVAVSSADVVYPIQIYVDKLIEYAGMILRKLPAEVSAGICKSGVHLSGGVSQIAGMAEYIEERLAMEVHRSEEPQMAVVLGGGRAIGNPTVLKKIKQTF